MDFIICLSTHCHSCNSRVVLQGGCGRGGGGGGEGRNRGVWFGVGGPFLPALQCRQSLCLGLHLSLCLLNSFVLTVYSTCPSCWQCI